MIIDRICSLYECNNSVKNWRLSCCCRTHQRIYQGRKAHGTENLPPKPKPDPNLKSKRNRRKNKSISEEERKALWSAYVVNRRKKRDKSMPVWANKNKILEFYIEARKLTIETGIKHVVDHVVPSNHNLVCGLHNEFNLQVLTEKENQIKSNKFKPY